jgi:uncharacterized protein
MASKKPLEEGYFEISDEGELTLLGSYSKAADVYFFPRRKLCPITGEAVEDVKLPREGNLYTWTYVALPILGNVQMGSQSKGHGVGQIDLSNGVRVQAVIEGAEKDWEIGMPMIVKPLTVFKQEEVEFCTFQFAPIKSGGK